MSSYSKPNKRQPVDFIRMDHQATVEHLRRFELKVLDRRDETWCSIASSKATEANNKDLNDQYKELRLRYQRDDLFKLWTMDETLDGLYWILRNFYKYPEEYVNALFASHYGDEDPKRLPCEWAWKNCHDGFWGKDPTK